LAASAAILFATMTAIGRRISSATRPGSRSRDVLALGEPRRC
jgi:hypothetical protein